MAAPKETTFTITLPTYIAQKLQELALKKNLEVDDFIRLALKATSRKSKFFNLDGVLDFGKYEGEALQNVIKVDPTYVVWCIRNIEGFLISDPAEEALIETLHSDGIEIGESLYKIKTPE